MDPISASQANVVLQFVIVLILFGGFGFKRRHKYFLHGATMLVAVVLNMFSFLFVMLPSLLGLEIIRTQPLHVFSIVALAHVCVGALSLILGTWIVGSWHLQSSTANCVKRRIIMRLVLILWLLALAMGIVLYMFLYTNF